MKEIFDREHDDVSTYHEPHISHKSEEMVNSNEETRYCSHCGSNIPSMVVICPGCGKWWTNSGS